MHLIMFALWWSCIREDLLHFNDIELLDSTKNDIIHRDITHCDIRSLQYIAITKYWHQNIGPLQHLASASFCHCNILQSQNFATSGRKKYLAITNIVLPIHFAFKGNGPPYILPPLTLRHQDVLQHNGHQPPWLGISSGITPKLQPTPSVLSGKKSTKHNRPSACGLFYCIQPAPWC